MKRAAREVKGIWALLMLIGAALPAAYGASESDPPARAQMSDDGVILVTSSGMTLYTFGPDDASPGKSQCSNVAVKGFPDPTSGFGTYPLPRAESTKSCVEQWPPYMASSGAKGVGDWSLVDRPEGGKQWAYRNRPLYLSIKDQKAGDRNGVVKIGQLTSGGRGWNLAQGPTEFPPGFKLVRREEGLVLATMNDRPVYARAAATAVPACAGCGEAFKTIAAPEVGTVGGDWSIVAAAAGVKQYAFRRKSLYAAPDELSDSEIAKTGQWETVVYRRAPATPPEIGKHFTLLGDVYTDSSGRTLYVFTCAPPTGGSVRCDNPGDPAQYWVTLCGDGKECARRWRPYLASPNARATGDWSVVDVAYPMFTETTGVTYPPDTPRVKGWAYRGRPVYTYYEDKEPGDFWGHATRWFALSGFYALQVPGHGLLE